VTENHGGEVTVESELGQGTVFEVRLPTLPSAP
jgi:signal transduction histidine kinase